MKEVRFHGRGGQGAVTAAKAFAEGALVEGKFIQAFPEYGPERMGAPVKSFTRISDGMIHVHSQVQNPEIVVVLDETLLDIVDVTEGISGSKIVIVNTKQSPAEIRSKIGLTGGKVYAVDASRISIETIGRDMPNTPLLGALVKVSELIGLESLMHSFREEFGKKFSEKVIEGNINAMKRAYEEVVGE
ncbi:MAG TPA: pyruvate synthase [Candidatus Altiarchaeales archaeon]|nr:pyruvate synthase [Candidatus Altiarchaeales archaeon]